VSFHRSRFLLANPFYVSFYVIFFSWGNLSIYDIKVNYNSEFKYFGWYIIFFFFTMIVCTLPTFCAVTRVNVSQHRLICAWQRACYSSWSDLVFEPKSKICNMLPRRTFAWKIILFTIWYGSEFNLIPRKSSLQIVMWNSTLRRHMSPLIKQKRN